MKTRLRHVALVHPFNNPPSLGLQVNPDFHELVYICNGTLHTEVDGERLTGTNDEYFYYYPGHERIKTEKVQVPETELVVVTWYADTTEADLNRQVLTRDYAGRMRYVTTRMVEIFNRYGKSERKVIDALFAMLQFELAHPLQRHEETIVNAVKVDILKFLGQKLTTEKLAKQANLSRSHFMRLFKQEVGMTPMKFVQQKRTERAIKMLLTSDLPLKTIARQVGVCNEFHLSKMIKESTGKSPKTLRQVFEREHKPGDLFANCEVEPNAIIWDKPEA